MSEMLDIRADRAPRPRQDNPPEQEKRRTLSKRFASRDAIRFSSYATSGGFTLSILFRIRKTSSARELQGLADEASSSAFRGSSYVPSPPPRPRTLMISDAPASRIASPHYR